MIPVLIKMKSGIRIKNFSYPPRWLFNIGGKFLEYTVPYSLTRTTRERGTMLRKRVLSGSSSEDPDDPGNTKKHVLARRTKIMFYIKLMITFCF